MSKMPYDLYNYRPRDVDEKILDRTSRGFVVSQDSLKNLRDILSRYQKDIGYVLTEAGLSGFSYSFGFEDLLQILIDIGSNLAELLQSGGMSKPTNPRIKFLDESDVLGNPRQVTLKGPQLLYQSDRIANFIWDFLQALIVFRNTGDERQFFMNCSSRTDPKTPKVPQKRKDSGTKQKELDKIIKSNTFYHLRRLQRNNRNRSSSTKK